MKNRRLIASALSASLLVSALPGLTLAQDEGPYPVEGVQWALNTMSGEAVPEGVEVSLFLSGGEVVGNAGCNSYFGSYEISAQSLTFPNAFGTTQMFCEGPAQETEDAYLPLLQSTAGWTVDDGGMLNLTDADGAVMLVYGEPPVDITATDIDALLATLEDLQMQIDTASAEVTALAEAAASINVNKFDKRLTSVEKNVTELDKKVGGISSANLKKRIEANETAIAANQGKISELNKTVNKLRDRIKALEENDVEQDARLDKLDEAVFVPTPTSD